MPTIPPKNPFYEAIGAIEDSNSAVATGAWPSCC